MSFAAPAALALAGLTIPIILLHVLRPRRVAHVVSSTFLWSEIARPVSSAKPWQKLRISALLIAQALSMLLLAASAARPVIEGETPLYPHTVFLVDASGSMAAVDGEPDRLSSALDRARELRRELPAGGEASLVEISTEPRVLLTRSTDEDAFGDALRRIGPAGGRGAFAEAFTLAAGLETAEASIGYVLISDGRLSDDEKALLPPDTRYERVGSRATNRAITRLSVQSRGSGLHVRVTVANTGGPEATQTLRIDVDGRTVDSTKLSLDRGATVEYSADVPGGDRVEAILEGEDLLASDNQAFAVASGKRELSVLVVGPNEPLPVEPDVSDGSTESTGETADDSAAAPQELDADDVGADPFLTALLETLGDLDIDYVGPDTPVASGQDVVIYDRSQVPDDPGAPFVAIAPPEGLAATLSVSGDVELPAITLVRGEDPILAGVDLSDVSIGLAQQVDAPTASVLVGAEETPLILRGVHSGRPYTYLSFALANSTFPLDVSYPIVLDRMLGELSGSVLSPSGLQVGDPLPIDSTHSARIKSPGGTTSSLSAGDPAPRANRTGFWLIESTGGGQPADSGEGSDDSGSRLLVVAVNSHPAESVLNPEPSLPTVARQETLEAGGATTQTSLLTWFVLATLLLLVVELLLARRVVGVSRRQWTAAVLLRFLVALLLVAALLDISVTRRDDRVAVAFLVDQSDSLGEQGRSDAVDFVQDALRDQPDDALSAVALFGADARLELLLDEDNSLGNPEVIVDPGRTDLANALRLAAAVLPEDARRRVVLVSDGRATRGDAAGEARRLRDQGIEVDVVVVEREVGPDAAVAGVEVPSRAFEGDEIRVDVLIDSSQAGPAAVTLTRDGDPIQQLNVELTEGRNLVRFVDTATGTSLQRYQARVSLPGDTITQNDSAYAAIEISGPPMVLVVEGVEGEAEAIVDALESGGQMVEVVTPDKIPALDELASYAATVLVDVDARSISADQMQDLAAAVQGMGRGLVTIGGERSYALGGYLDSELETLLPVTSEITDPKRRRTVAEVLAIDTSGSMGACHCNEGSNGVVTGGNRGPMGGVSKTDISRSAAARAIDALSVNDEVGVLAFDSGHQWVIPLEKLPSEEVILEGLESLRPSGGTDLSSSLTESADALRASKASLRHIILFTDGFTEVADMESLADQAAELRDEGITVSVIATGEGADSHLEPIAENGGGRYYPGRDLAEIPQIMVEETIIATRSYVNEGEFLPSVTSASAVVAELTSSPPLFGFVATTPRPAASTLLRIGDEGDPLLATWQAGLGRSTAWTSDASARWSAAWADWEGYVDFWSAVVKDVMPVGSDRGGVRAWVDDGELQLVLDGVEPWPEGTEATARVTSPSFEATEVRLERVDDRTFRAAVPASEAGTYAVGVQAGSGDSPVFGGRALANQGYAAEYRAGPSDDAELLRVSELSGGRGVIESSAAFDADDLVQGRTRLPLAPILLVAAAILWPLAVTLSRLTFTGRGVLVAREQLSWMTRRLRAIAPSLPGREPSAPSAPPTERPRIRQAEQRAEPAPPETVGRLLDRKRQRNEGSGGSKEGSGGSKEQQDPAG